MSLRAFLAALSAAALIAALPAVALADDAGDYEQVVDITFPTARVSGRTPITVTDGTHYGFIDDYHHARSSNNCGVHRATDIFGEAGQPVYAAVAGSISWMPETVQRYGWMISIQADDDRVYHYVHLGHDEGTRETAYASGLSQGDRVERGQHIGYLGSSGNASEELPHLHFEIHDASVTESNEWGCEYINPYNSLVDAVERGDFAAEVPARAPDRRQEETRQEDAEDSEAAEVDRVAGPDRVATTLRMITQAFDSADRVVLAPAQSFPEAAVAGPLAAALSAPVLTTWADSLDDRVADVLRDLGATEVVLVGGLDVLSDRVVAQLVSKAGLESDDIERIWGVDAFETAARVAERVWDVQGSRERVVVALGDHPDPDRSWPDALTSSWYGAVVGAPVLLVDHDRMPAPTIEALPGVDQAVVVGGTAAVTERLAEIIARRVDTLVRLSGSDRFATAAAVADALLGDEAVSAGRVWAATGYNWADALAAAQPIAAHGDLLVLVDGQAQGRDASIDGWFAERRADISAGRVIGGSAAVSDDAMELLLERIS